MNIKAYLDRINVKSIEKPDLKYLTKLKEQHLLHIPFENLDVIDQNPIILDTNRFFDKLINKRRGGFCFELNGLFNKLLKEIGFQVKLVPAKVRTENSSWAESGEWMD